MHARSGAVQAGWLHAWTPAQQRPPLPPAGPAGYAGYVPAKLPPAKPTGARWPLGSTSSRGACKRRAAALLLTNRHRVVRVQRLRRPLLL